MEEDVLTIRLTIYRATIYNKPQWERCRRLFTLLLEPMYDVYRCFRALAVLGWAAREERYG